ncbi:sulfatase [Halorubrum ezzemoulense]|uniref:Sulfatase n=1 Tax=Halorubrum ezzemoulense TaxID=337243 RepID=A0A256IU68_HALEZ|nr:sulfatase [Halorubrum ezzemoulense]OYR60104.1 sulfatase [Halorubrum ezzemoulense]
MTDTPNVLFILLDSMRTDRVSCYGHDRETTPNLDEFANQATRYTNAYTPAPWTLPTHTSLFTGLFPSEHGVTNAFPDSNLQLSSEIPTLAEKFQDNGYQTAGFSNNPWVGKTSGLDRGFDDYVEWNLEIGAEATPSIHTRTDRFASQFHSFVGHAARQPVYLLKRPFFTDSLSRRASDWMESASNGDQPWFCFMNLMEAHSPYFPRKWAFQDLNLETPGRIEPRILNTKLLAYVMGKADLDRETRKRVMEFYDASLRYQDRKVAEVLNQLRANEVYDDTLIIICSDHGKTLGGFDRSGSPPHYLRDINTRVPLLVKAPDQDAAEVVDTPTELVSTHHYAIEGATKPVESYQPDSNHALFEDHIPHTGRQSPDDGVTYWRGLGTADGKLVRSDTGESYLFVGQGFEEQTVNARDRKPELTETLSERVDQLRSSSVDGGGNKMDDLGGDVQAQLEDLGYMK